MLTCQPFFSIFPPAGQRIFEFLKQCWKQNLACSVFLVPEQASGLPISGTAAGAGALCRSRPLACQFPDQPPVWGHAPPGEGLHVPVQPPSLLVAASPAHRPHMLCTWHTQPWPPVWLIHENRAPHNLRFFFPQPLGGLSNHCQSAVDAPWCCTLNDGALPIVMIVCKCSSITQLRSLNSQAASGEHPMQLMHCCVLTNHASTDCAGVVHLCPCVAPALAPPALPAPLPLPLLAPPLASFAVPSHPARPRPLLSRRLRSPRRRRRR